MNHLKLTTAPLFLVLLVGCAKPGLRSVNPYGTELVEANLSIRTQQLEPSRNLPRSDWQPTLDRVVARILPAARTTCAEVSAWNCDKINQPIGIIDDPAINAFVDTQHQISAHAGLLVHAASDEEIAAVLAHEFGHVFARHIEKQQGNATIGMLAAAAAGLVIAGTTGVDVTKEAMEAGYKIGATAYSQASELEADYYAALILENSGIDLAHGRNLLLRLARTSGGQTGEGVGVWGEKARLMATTHPSDNYRIARWLGVTRSIDAGKQLQGSSPFSRDDDLRQDAWNRLLSGPAGLASMTRWVNPGNGHSGMFTISKVEYDSMHCGLMCIEISQVDYVQEQQERSLHRSCRAGGEWVSKDPGLCSEEQLAGDRRTFVGTQYLTEEKEVPALLVLHKDFVQAVDSGSGMVLKEIPYHKIKTAQYSFSEHRRWRAGIAVAVVANVFAAPLFFMKGKKHWLVFETDDEDQVALHLDKKNYQAILATIESKAKLKIEGFTED